MKAAALGAVSIANVSRAAHQSVRKVFIDAVLRKIYKLYGTVLGWYEYKNIFISDATKREFLYCRTPIEMFFY